MRNARIFLPKPPVMSKRIRIFADKMRLPDKFREYIWLVNTISYHRSISLNELNELWVQTEMSGGLPMARNTFLRHKDAIEQMFGIYIECDAHRGYRYYIGNEYVLKENSVQNWLLKTLTVSSLLSENVSMQERILLEDVACDSVLLQRLIAAMRGCRKIELCYRRYQAASAKTYTVEPYCLKLFRQRWYLLARFEGGDYAVFAFDRMERLTVLAERFVMDEYFDAADFFSECYGVVVGDGSQPQRIVIRAFGREQFAMRDLPLHHTQHVIAETSDYTDFEVVVRLTSDLKAHLLSRGRWLKVLQPQSLADEIRQLHLEAAE